MKVRLKPFASILFLSGFIAAPAMAVSANSSNNAQMQSLQAAVASLQKEVRSLKSQLNNSDSSSSGSSSGTTNGKHSYGQHHYNVTTTDAPPQSKLKGKELMDLIHQQAEYLPFDMDVPGQAFVSTGPYVGVPIQYAGSNLIINSPSVNTDLQLLGIRKNIIKQLVALGGENFKEPYHSHLLLSGLVEAEAGYLNKSGRINGGAPSTDIDVTNMSIDFTFLGPSDWTLGFVELTYDNTSPKNSIYTSTSNYTVANSRVLVNKAFITIGDLMKSPFYGSVGQFYVPFGVYSSFMVSQPFTTILTRTKARAIELGMAQQDENAFYGSLYIFRGDSHVASTSKINNGGINLGYKFKTLSIVTANIGGGMIANIADSGGMQVGTNFQQYEQIHNRVPGYNLHANIAFGDHIDLLGEYVGASNRFDIRDMSYNKHPAKPSALDLEAVYTFTILDKPTSIGIGYQKSNQALAVGIPLIRYSLVLNTSLWRNTLQSLEFRHDREYATSDVATGAGNQPVPVETGKSDNAAIAQFDYYF